MRGVSASCKEAVICGKLTASPLPFVQLSLPCDSDDDDDDDDQMKQVIGSASPVFSLASMIVYVWVCIPVFICCFVRTSPALSFPQRRSLYFPSPAILHHRSASTPLFWRQFLMTLALQCSYLTQPAHVGWESVSKRMQGCHFPTFRAALSKLFALMILVATAET